MINPPSLASPSALSLVSIPPALGRLAKLLALFMFLVALGIGLVPWRQAVPGAGRVIAFVPQEREQMIEAPIGGRITEWFVNEGDSVQAGDKLVVLADRDPLIVQRLAEQRDAAIEQLQASQSQVVAYEKQIDALERSRALALEAADAKIRMGENKVLGAESAVQGAKALYRASKLDLKRQTALEREGLGTRQKFEVARAKAAKDQAEIYKAQADWEGARADVLAARASREKDNADATAKIESARSSLAKARAAIAKAQQDLAKAEVSLSQQANLVVEAPRAGTVVRVLARQGGEWVKPGDPLVLLVPDTDSRAVELWVSGNDASLIEPGRQVRLQFEGWPAIQFTGWPAVAVGTFGGVVAFVDAAASAKGKFRIVVVPGEHKWPAARYLRQGVRTQGWVLLDQVRLGYEIWRQLNAFPPSVLPGNPTEYSPENGSDARLLKRKGSKGESDEAQEGEKAK